MKTLILFVLAMCLTAPTAFCQGDTPAAKCGSEKIKAVTDKDGKRDSIEQVQARLSCYAQQAAQLAAELQKTRKSNEDLAAERDRLDAINKRLIEDNSTLKLEKQHLTEERSKLTPVWANTSVHQFDWNKYSVDSCKNEAIKAVTARQGVLNNQTPTSINFTLKGTTVTVECRAQTGGFVTVASHTFGEAVDISRELDDAIFSP